MTAPRATAWLRVLDQLVPVPAGHREPTLDVPAAARELGCGPDVVTALIAAGLPAGPGPDGWVLDRYDMMNLGLLSGSGRSTAELGERRLMALAAGDPAGWMAERTWRVALRASCSRAGCAAPARPLAPAPALTGGRLLAWHQDPTDPAAAEAVVQTRGRAGAPRTAAVRDLYDDLLAALISGRYRYGWVPPSLDAGTAAALGLVNCTVAAALLADAAAAAGLPARTRAGVLLGLVGVEHAWTEVEEDGRWVPLDPVLAHLARRTPGTSPQFADFCRGSTSNRLLPWDLPAERRVVEHECPEQGRAVLRCQPRPEIVHPGPEERGD